jgi:two-component system chemotaxis response regulator CheY
MENRIGEMIKFLRKQQGVTQDELANYLTVSNQSVSKWETGQANPDVTYIPQIAEFFGVTIDTLFNVNPEMANAEFNRAVSGKTDVLLSDDIDSLINMWQILHAKYPNDAKVERELIAAFCLKSDIKLLDDIFYHTARLLRMNQSRDIENEVLRGLKLFLQSIIKNESEKSDSFNRKPYDDLVAMLKTVPQTSTRDLILMQSEIDAIFGKPAVKPAGKNVLIVDDAYIMRMMLRDIITREGAFTVAGEACDGVEAVEKARELRPDIILMDITMPNMDGITAAGKILEENPATAVIFVSAMGQRVCVDKALYLGAVDFVVKPFIPNRVLEAVKRLYP